MIKLHQLQSHLHSLGPIAVAVSGGVDSMTLAVVAHRSNPDVEIFHAISPAVPVQATARVKHYAKQESWRLRIIDANEIEDPDYLANPANRCYFCKTNLYDTVTRHTEHTVLSGTNLDDLGDYRPGLIAAEEHQVIHPYVQLQIDKLTLRAIARELQLNDLSDLPAAPCLSSRIETGINIDPKLLPVINDVEEEIWQQLQTLIALKGVRCRLRKNGIVVELETNVKIDTSKDYAKLATEIVIRHFLNSGYTHQAASISIEPYQRGSAFLIETLNID